MPREIAVSSLRALPTIIHAPVNVIYEDYLQWRCIYIYTNLVWDWLLLLQVLECPESEILALFSVEAFSSIIFVDSIVADILAPPLSLFLTPLTTNCIWLSKCSLNDTLMSFHESRVPPVSPPRALRHNAAVTTVAVVAQGTWQAFPSALSYSSWVSHQVTDEKKSKHCTTAYAYGHTLSRLEDG